MTVVFFDTAMTLADENMNVLDSTKPRFRTTASFYRSYWDLCFNAAFIFKSLLDSLSLLIRADT